MKMPLANARCKLNHFGTDVPVFGITPAEAMVLIAMHSASVGTNPLGKVEEMEAVGETGDDRHPRDEIKRLSAKYGTKKVKTIIPSAADVPATFEEAFKFGLEAETPEPSNYLSGDPADVPPPK